jgi:sec-independent protein translocase protein TatA
VPRGAKATGELPLLLMPNVGPLEIAGLLLLALLLFGAKRLPEIGKSLGKGMREFKDSISGKDDDDDHQPELTQSSTTTETPAPPPSQPREHDTVP